MLMNLVPTTEQRVEEVHARIHFLNMSPGRSLDPPSTSSRLRLKEHLFELQDWKCLSFVSQIWGRRVERELLKPVMTQEFVQHAPKVQCIGAVYNTLQQQLFSNVNHFTKLNVEFKRKAKPAIENVPAKLKLAIDYWKDRLSSGVLFSMPGMMLRGVLHGVGNSSEVVGALDLPDSSDADLLDEAIALARSGFDDLGSVRIGRAFGGHRFFRVVRANLSSRFIQYDDGERGVCIAIMETSLVGRDGAAGVFRPSLQGASCRLNLKHLLRLHGMRNALQSVIVWEQAGATTLSLTMPSAGNAATSLQSLQAIGDSTAPMAMRCTLTTTRRMLWEETVASLMCAMDSDRPLSYDTASNKIASPDGGFEMSVHLEDVQDMVAAGVLTQGAGENGKMLLQVDLRAVCWRSSSALLEGSADPVRHVSRESPQQHPKLTIIMKMLACQWQPGHGNDLTYFAAGQAQEFDLNTSRPKNYFAALLCADRILYTLAIADESSLPIILHGMPDAYYRSLLQAKSTNAVKSLLALLDGSTDVRAMSNASFNCLKDIADFTDKEATEEEARQAMPALLDDEPSASSRADMEHMHKSALAVLRAIPSALVDMRAAMQAEIMGHTYRVHFDNCSHASGKQRAYIGCRHEGHSACFRYSIVERHPTMRRAAAVLISWAAHAADKPKSFTKEQHKRYQPEEVDVDTVEALIVESA